MSRLISPLGRVTIGSDTFVSGDGLLQSVEITLSEDKKSSSCRFQVYDPDLKFGAKYQKLSLKTGGIVTPDGLLKDIESAPSVSSTPIAPGGITASSTSTGGSARNASLSPEERAFLDTIAFSEGTAGHGDDGYNVIVGYKYFSNYSRHPDVYVRSANSTAAGRYQFLNTTWNGRPGQPGLKQQLGLKDFSPTSQDLGAIELIRQAEALSDVKRGSAGLEAALYKCRSIWASFPASPYNQPRKKLSELKNVYIQALLKYQRQSPAQQVAATQPQVKDKAVIADKAISKPVEIAEKGCEIIVELGFSLDQMVVARHFFHVATTTSRGSLDTTTFEGQSIRWLLNRRTQNTAYSNITLRQLAQKTCDRYRLKLVMEGSGPLYQHLDQTGISDYELLLREARSIGYSIRESGNQLILMPYRPTFTGFVITQDILQSIRFSDRASTDRSPTPGTTVSTPAVPAADSKAKIDRLTGKSVQTKVEDTTGTGAKTEAKTAVTGAAVPAVRGTPKPTTSSTADEGATNDPVTGLPKQEVGSIDLGDGRAEAQIIQDEARRVKGYESTCSIITTPEALTLAPGSIVGVSDEVAPDPFNREWRLFSVRHSLNNGGMRSELNFYSPQAAKQESSSTTPALSNTATSTSVERTQLKPGGFILPCPGNTGDGVNSGGNGRRKHMGIDIANPHGPGTPIVASADGIVVELVTGCRVGDLGCGGGFGNYLSLQHANGYYTRYAHCQEIFVSKGQKVTQGSKIATMGTTGRSYPVGRGWHCHWEIRKGGLNGLALPPSAVGVKVPLQHRSGFRY